MCNMGFYLDDEDDDWGFAFETVAGMNRERVEELRELEKKIENREKDYDEV